MIKHSSQRIRHETRQRTLTVRSTLQLTPGMLRIVLSGADLEGFTSPSADDYIKLMVPDCLGGTQDRDFTPRYFDAVAQELTIDIATHPAGAAIDWAKSVQEGESISIDGPKASLLVSNDFDWWLLVGDETSLPSIGRRVEELDGGIDVTTIVAVADEQEQQSFVTNARHKPMWVHRPRTAAASASAIMEVLEGMALT